MKDERIILCHIRQKFDSAFLVVRVIGLSDWIIQTEISIEVDGTGTENNCDFENDSDLEKDMTYLEQRSIYVRLDG